MVEICCGSYYDAKQAALGGAERIELNCALALGGLTPTASVVRMVKESLPLKVIAMVRPRGGGFCYSAEDFEVMKAECRAVLEAGADGAAFGCLDEDARIDAARSRELISIIRDMGGEAVFHRAFDCVRDPFAAMEQLIGLGVDRVLTSGQKPKACDGVELLRQLQERYGSRIELLAGSGVNASNAAEIIEKTGLSQVHSSCKDWLTDPTTVQNGVSYSMAGGEHSLCYDVVSAELVKKILERVNAADPQEKESAEECSGKSPERAINA
ncbi:MAG: copper homeostasis protein CutC [Eubacteriales bacterium]|nr:copper homeostasis protein CutC [Eubacteriales bacterium]